MDDKKVNVALIASGSGTDAESIMKAYNAGQTPDVNLKLLVSTKDVAGCLRKAEEQKIPSQIISVFGHSGPYHFNKILAGVLKDQEIELVFLVGCIIRIEPIEGIDIYNIHPAELQATGGKGMYGLEPHKRVLANIQDLIARERAGHKDKFFTYPTVHEVTAKYDAGDALLVAAVPIPFFIIEGLVRKAFTLEEAAKSLQRYVLPYEWQMLPLAVNLAAKRIMDRRNKFS